MITTQLQPDTLQSAASTAYDSVWAAGNQAAPTTSALETIMLAQDKLYVVLAVVLIIWLGLMFFISRTDRRIREVERTLEERIPEKTS